MISFAETVLNTKPNKPEEENIIPYTYEETVMCIYEYGECYRNLNRELSLFSEADGTNNPGKIQRAIAWLKKMWAKFIDWLKRVFGFANANHGNVTPETLDALYEELIKNIVSKPVSDISIPDVVPDNIDTSDVDFSLGGSTFSYSVSLRKGLQKIIEDTVKYTGNPRVYISSNYDISSVYKLYVIAVDSAHKMYKRALENDKIAENDIVSEMNDEFLYNGEGDKHVILFMCGIKPNMTHISSTITNLIRIGIDISGERATINSNVINSMMEALDRMIPSYTHKYENGRLVVTRTDLSCEDIIDIGGIGNIMTQTIQKNDTRMIHSFKINTHMDISALSKTIETIPTNANIALLTDIINHLTIVMEQYHVDATAAIYANMIQVCSRVIYRIGGLAFDKYRASRGV